MINVKPPGAMSVHLQRLCAVRSTLSRDREGRARGTEQAVQRLATKEAREVDEAPVISENMFTFCFPSPMLMYLLPSQGQH
jgi:hypothetical protein